jgi:hypothetical protein
VTFSGNSQTTNSSEEDSDVDHSDASKAQETSTNRGCDIACLKAEVLVYEDKKTGKIKSMNTN